MVLSHEYGHYFVAKKLGYKLDSFFLAPYGACLNYKEKAFECKDEIKIALAGPLVNLMFCLLMISLWWIFPVCYNFTIQFVVQSFSLAVFNLLPCYPLDGGRVFVCLMSKFKPRKWAIKVTQIFNLVISLILLMLFFISCFYNFNPTLCLSGCFMLFGIFESKNESKYQPSFIFKKKAKNFSKPIFVCINGSVCIGEALKHIENNRFTIFVVILSNHSTRYVDEQKVKLFSLQYNLYATFDDIFLKNNIEKL